MKSLKNATFHPMDPLTDGEMADVSMAVKQHIAKDTSIKAIKFMTMNYLLPPKKDVLKYLGIPSAPGEKVTGETVQLSRRAETDFIDLVTGDSWNARTTFVSSTSEWKVDKMTKLPVGVQPQISVQELIMAEDTIKADKRCIQLAAEVGVSPDQLCADGWSIGYDDRFPESTRLQQCLLYARFGKDENLYAHPLDFFPVIDSNSLEVIHIDFAPHRSSKTGTLSVTDTTPPPLSDVADALKASGRERVPPPMTHHDYLPELIALRDEANNGLNPEGVKIRQQLKPLHVVQPEGVSFKMNGNEIEWQKWKLHAAFSHREGIAISTVTYNDDGEIRPIVYRLSLVEMVVPYAAPEHPHPRKFAFDVGEYGMGTQANELSLGCDCLGKIHYLPGSYIGHDGLPVNVKNAICIHEEDAGLLWKHTDFRPGGRAHSVRSRRLVISMICTVANYEYCFYYYFYQDGTIELEIRLTGILNVYVLGQGETAGAYGTEVAPGISAQYHQHIFSVRVDPMVDGLRNSVVESDLVPVPHKAGSKENYAGNAFVVKETVLGSGDIGGVREYNSDTDRRWRIINPARKHYASGKEVSYTLGIKGSTVSLLAQPDGWAARRAGFATKTLWVVRDREDNPEEEERLFPAGKYVPQTRECPSDSVVKWSEEGAITGEDILVFVTLGINHVPRPEDWPVMPSEHVRFSLRPVHFFKSNPALDVIGVLDKQSTPAFANGVNGHGVNGNGNGSEGSCCDGSN